MTTLIDKIEQLIKREKTTPERKQKPATQKSSSEILSEIFSALNAEPPKIEENLSKKSKKGKKKHKKEKKKRARSTSSSSSYDSDNSHKHKKRKKSKTKKRKDRDRSRSRSKTPVTKLKRDRRDSYKRDLTPEVTIKNEIKKEPKTEKLKTSLKVEDQNDAINSIDANAIPMPESPVDIDDDIKAERPSGADTDKLKGKIQIKNLKFSTVFEETVKQAEEEARKKAEKYEDGECSRSSSSEEKEEVSNSQFPKSSDPGGILKKKAVEIKPTEEPKIVSKKSKSEHSHKSSRRERSKSRKRSTSKSRRSRSRSGSKKHHHRSSSKSRKRSRSRHRSRSSRRSRHRSRSRSRRRSTSRTRHRIRHSPRHRTRRSSRSPSGVKLADSEKKRLLEVARRNAINMLKNGAVPAGAAVLPPHTRNQVMAAIQSGGKSVDELTDFCKHLSKKEALGELSSVSSNDEGLSENEDTIAFHHPFLVKEKAPIVMNIRGGAPLPVKSSAVALANKDELRIQFPVSSGSQHREKASEWVPVSPKKDNMQVAKLNAKAPSRPDLLPADIAKSSSPPAPLALPPPPVPPALYNHSAPTQIVAVPPPSAPLALPALPAPGPQAYPPGIEPPKLDIAAIVCKKLSLIRKEQEDSELCITRGFGWSKSQKGLGEFTGSTGASILTPRELASGMQAWAKKDQLTRAAPVEGGMGMHLLQKMGWTPGQGLGKEGTGTLQPLLLEVKLDTKGLQAKEEVSSRNKKAIKQVRPSRRGPAPLVAGGKHPVSLLGEYCSKQKLGPPEYTLCFECGPDHKKNFLFRVKVAGIEYQPAVASANKKQAKADAASLALQKLGIVIT